MDIHLSFLMTDDTQCDQLLQVPYATPSATVMDPQLRPLNQFVKYLSSNLESY